MLKPSLSLAFAQADGVEDMDVAAADANQPGLRQFVQDARKMLARDVEPGCEHALARRQQDLGGLRRAGVIGQRLQQIAGDALGRADARLPRSSDARQA